MNEVITMAETVLITGSSRGIGKACALAFANRGFNIILNCINGREKMLETEKEIRKTNPNVISCLCDVSDNNEVNAMIAEAEKAFGGVDVLVNNAGISFRGLFQDMTPNQWKRITDIDLLGVFNLTHAVLPYMLSRKKGCIINVSSIWGVAGGSCEAVYSAAKGGVNAFTKALAKELGPSGIRINAVYPGCIDTDMNNDLTDEDKKAFAEEIPLMRLGKPSEVAETILFLSSDSASYINGQILGVDGGFL